MRDRITFDFRSGEIIFDTPTQEGVEVDPNLKDKKAAIFAAAGYRAYELEDVIEEFNPLFRCLGIEEVKLFEKRK